MPTAQLQQRRTRRRRRRTIAALVVLCLFAVAVALAVVFVNKQSDAAPETQPEEPTESLSVDGEVEVLPTESVAKPIDPDAPVYEGFVTEDGPAVLVYDIDDPASITVVVNKQRAFNPVDWAPDDLRMPNGIPNNNGQPLRAEAADALEKMNAAAREAGHSLRLVSGYRSYQTQQVVFNRRLNELGREGAEARSSRPGHSEHQTGLTVDLDDGRGCELNECFGETPAGLWLRENAYRYGYILRYENGYKETVGFQYEPWHFRYVGLDVARDMHENDIITLEGYFGLPDAPDY